MINIELVADKLMHLSCARVCCRSSEITESMLELEQFG